MTTMVKLPTYTPALPGKIPKMPLSIRDLLSPRKLWNALQAWKKIRELKSMFSRVLPNYGSGMPQLDALSSMNLQDLQGMLGSLIGDLNLGGTDKDFDGDTERQDEEE